jgi:murein DD-endopeptidase MepM/ murein hydrolase activator NlpD
MRMKIPFGLLAITGVLLSTDTTWAWVSRSANQTKVVNKTLDARSLETGNLADPENVNLDTDNPDNTIVSTGVDTDSNDTNGGDKVSDPSQSGSRNSIATTQNFPPLRKFETKSSAVINLVPVNTVATLPTQPQSVFSSDVAVFGGRTDPRFKEPAEPVEASIVIPVPPPLTQTIVRPVAKTRKAPNVVIVNTTQPSSTIIPVTSATGNAPTTTITEQIAIYPLLNPAPITSRFGWRTHPLTGVRRFHSGVDIGAPTGTPVVATVSGTVVSAGWNGGYGKAVIIQQPNGVRQTLYGHLSQISVQAGQTIEQGTVLGLVGSTGQSTGPHLHYEDRVANSGTWVAIDPGAEIKYALDVLKRADPYARKDLPAGL